MIKRHFRFLAALFALGAHPAAAQDFDYYLLALSWNPSWCAAEGDARGAAECTPQSDLGFTVHGLWPQYEDGWPEYCETDVADPSRRDTAAMADIMGSGGLAWYQWKKHGRCSGLDAADYFSRTRTAFDRLGLPDLGAQALTAGEVGSAFLDANPELDPAQLVVTCAGGRLAEVRLCLTPDLSPRACAADVRRDACSGRTPLEIPPR